MTLQKAGQRWASFSLREDQLNDLSISSPVELTSTDHNTVIKARVDEIVPRGEFATWRAARAVGDYDLTTFLICADPTGHAEAFQPGMSVWLRGRLATPGSDDNNSKLAAAKVMFLNRLRRRQPESLRELCHLGGSVARRRCYSLTAAQPSDDRIGATAP
jgi:hypothetical protein